jgi:nucleoside diphosphate kinase
MGTVFAKAAEVSNCDPAIMGVCLPSALPNSAFVFIKPHANTPATQALVREKLHSAGIVILSEQEIAGSVIDDKKLIDQHYYAIASKATILTPMDIAVPRDKFEEAFGESWDKVLEEGRACNAMEATKQFQCTAHELDEAWRKAKVTKFGGGFYCGLMEMNSKKLYVFNAFFMAMRSKFVGDTSIYYFEVQWPANKLSWSDFRGKLLGPTDPAKAPEGSLRNEILKRYKDLGLTAEPNQGDNGVHASASPFEGLAERINWLGKSVEDDMYGKALLDSGFSKDTIQAWSVDPRVKQPDGSEGSVFDALEDTDAAECVAKLIELNKLNPS